MSRHIGFAETSRARNVYLQPNGSQELDEYNVPTKHNRGAVAMTNPAFNASDPQSSAVRLGRATGNAMWSPELSALNTYPTQNMGVAARDRAAMKEHYGNRWVNGTITRDEESERYFQRKRAIEGIYRTRLAECHAKWRASIGLLPADLVKEASQKITDIRMARRQNRMSMENFRAQVAEVTAARNAAIAKIDPKKLDAYESELESIQDDERAELAEIRREYDRAISANLLPVALRRPPAQAAPFENRLRNSLGRAAAASASGAKGGRSRRQSRQTRRRQTRRQRR